MTVTATTLGPAPGRAVSPKGPGRYAELSVAEWDARADASARHEVYQALGGWGWNVRPGAYRRCQAWWGRTRYLADVTEALASADSSRERAGMVSAARCRAVAEVLADSADHRTGRNAMPGIDSLIERTGYCQRSVQYAIGALERLGYLERIGQGRNWLTRAERLQLWHRGSTARAHRAIWALTTPAPAARFSRPAPRRPTPAGAVDNSSPLDCPDLGTCTLPSKAQEESSSSVFCVVNSSKKSSDRACGHSPSDGLAAEKTKGAAPPHPASKRHRKSPWAVDLIDLVIGLQRALPGLLGHERPSRLAGTLSRFHTAGWDVLSLETLLRDACAAKGRTLTDYRPTRPYAWLATVLRPIDHHDHPQLLAAVDRMYDRLYAETYCPHDVERGQLPTAAGIMPCPLCRRLASQP